MRLFALVLLLALLVMWGLNRHRAQGRKYVSLRALWLAPLAITLQIPLLQGWGTRETAAALHVFSYGLLLLFTWLNRHIAPVRVMGVGFLLNFLVIAANGGFMPIAPETLARMRPSSTVAEWKIGGIQQGSKDIVLPRAQTRFWFLSDIFVLPPLLWGPTAFSVGDIVIFVGFVWLCRYVF